MNNEPVAWMETYKGEPNNLDWDKSNLNYGSEFHDVVPLYINPVKEQRMIDVLMELSKYRLLSKEEIEEVAILRKASEK